MKSGSDGLRSSVSANVGDAIEGATINERAAVGWQGKQRSVATGCAFIIVPTGPSVSGNGPGCDVVTAERTAGGIALRNDNRAAVGARADHAILTYRTGNYGFLAGHRVITPQGHPAGTSKPQTDQRGAIGPEGNRIRAAFIECRRKKCLAALTGRQVHNVHPDIRISGGICDDESVSIRREIESHEVATELKRCEEGIAGELVPQHLVAAGDIENVPP